MKWPDQMHGWKTAEILWAALFAIALGVAGYFALQLDKQDERIRTLEKVQAERSEFVRGNRLALSAFAVTTAKVDRIEGMVEVMMRFQGMKPPPAVDVERAIQAAKDVEDALDRLEETTEAGDAETDD